MLHNVRATFRELGSLHPYFYTPKDTGYMVWSVPHRPTSLFHNIFPGTNFRLVDMGAQVSCIIFFFNSALLRIKPRTRWWRT